MTAGSGMDFRDQFAIEPVGDDGVLIDLRTGGFFRLNPTATKACLALQQSASFADAASLLAASLEVLPAEAAALLESVQSQLAAPGVRTEPVGPFRYRPNEGGYALEDNGRVVLTMDTSGRTLRLEAHPDTLAFKMLDYVRAVTPKLLHLRGVTVLHASACLLPEGLTAFSGRSGAGKTTTARAFERAGARLISQDLVVLTAASTPAVVLDGESRAHAWAAATADTLAGGSVAELSCGGLAHVTAPGPELSLRAIWFVDSARRSGHGLQRQRLAAVDGTLALLANSFLGSESPESWRRHVRETHGIVASLALWDVTTPDGLDRLAAAARDYATKTAS
jgi:hypothetical protein